MTLSIIEIPRRKFVAIESALVNGGKVHLASDSVDRMEFRIEMCGPDRAVRQQQLLQGGTSCSIMLSDDTER